MKLFAQIGHGLGDKVTTGLEEKNLDGAIFSPKDLRKDTMEIRISEIRQNYPNVEILVDPQFYVSLYSNSPETNIGNLSDWKFFRNYRKGDLELSQAVDQVLESYFKEIISLKVTGIVAPNIYISQSFDSREAVIAKNFVRQARKIYKGFSDNRPLFTSLVICREAPISGNGIADLLVFNWFSQENQPLSKFNDFLDLNPTIRAFEFKLKNWRSGIMQAHRYKYFSNSSILVVPKGKLKSIDSDLDIFRTLRVGLWAFNPETGGITIRYTPRPKKQHIPKYGQKALNLASVAFCS